MLLKDMVQIKVKVKLFFYLMQEIVVVRFISVYNGSWEWHRATGGWRDQRQPMSG